jgi:hypothetical protein
MCDLRRLAKIRAERLHFRCTGAIGETGEARQGESARHAEQRQEHDDFNE